MNGAEGGNDTAVAGENQEGNYTSNNIICSQAPVYGLNSNDGFMEPLQQHGTIQSVPWGIPLPHSIPSFGLGMPHFSGPAIHHINYFSEPGEYNIVQFSQEPFRSGTHAEPGLPFQTSCVTGDYEEIRNTNTAQVTNTGIEAHEAEVKEGMEIEYLAKEDGVDDKGVIIGAFSETGAIIGSHECQKEEGDTGDAAQTDTAPIPQNEENNENEDPTNPGDDEDMEIDSCCANLLSLEIKR